LQRRVGGFLRRNLVVELVEADALQEPQHDDPADHQCAEGRDHARPTPGDLTLLDFAGKEVDLGHLFEPPGRARPTATASSASARAGAWGDGSSSGLPRWNPPPGPAGVPSRS